MAPSLESRVAENTEAIRGLRGDVQELRGEHKEDHHRLRGLEATVAHLIDSEQDARRAAQAQLRRVEIRLQQLALAVAFAAVLVSVVLAIIHH